MRLKAVGPPAAAPLAWPAALALRYVRYRVELRRYRRVLLAEGCTWDARAADFAADVADGARLGWTAVTRALRHASVRPAGRVRPPRRRARRREATWVSDAIVSATCEVEADRATQPAA